MTRFLLATDSVHTTAAACDYLAGRLSDGDAVTAVTVREPGADPRDGEDALNVATVRLGVVTSVETAVFEREPASAILDAAADHQVDEVVLGARSGEPGASAGVGETARAVLTRAPVPVVVVPLPGLE